MAAARLVLQILPFTVLGLLSSALGAWSWSPATTSGATLVRALILLLVFLGLLAMKRTPNWNVVMLITFGFMAGSFAELIPSDRGGHYWLLSVGIASTLLILCFWLSRILRRRPREFGPGLWLLTWFYVVGWAGFLLLDVDPILQLVWIGFGLALFAGLGVVWFSNAPLALGRTPGSTLGIDLYLIMLNMIVVSRLLWQSIPR